MLKKCVLCISVIVFCLGGAALAGEEEKYSPEFDSPEFVQKYLDHLLSVATERISNIVRFNGMDAQCPVILLYYDGPYRRLASSPQDTRDRGPKFCLALWNDGKIIWGKPESNQSLGSGVPSLYRRFRSFEEDDMYYFQSQISTDKIEAFFREIDKIDCWQYSRKGFLVHDVPRWNMFFQNDNRIFSYGFYNSDLDGGWNGEVNCRQIVELVLGLIPDQGEKVEITIKEALVKNTGTNNVSFIFPEVVCDVSENSTASSIIPVL